jgi:hypothetical protein
MEANTMEKYEGEKGELKKRIKMMGRKSGGKGKIKRKD